MRPKDLLTNLFLVTAVLLSLEPSANGEATQARFAVESQVTVDFGTFRAVVNRHGGISSLHSGDKLLFRDWLLHGAFRREGSMPEGDTRYFQEAPFEDASPTWASLRLEKDKAVITREATVVHKVIVGPLLRYEQELTLAASGELTGQYRVEYARDQNLSAHPTVLSYWPNAIFLGRGYAIGVGRDRVFGVIPTKGASQSLYGQQIRLSTTLGVLSAIGGNPTTQVRIHDTRSWDKGSDTIRLDFDVYEEWNERGSYPRRAGQADTLELKLQLPVKAGTSPQLVK